MKILLTGVHGQVGGALLHTLKDHQVVGVDRSQLDLSRPEQIQACIEQVRPQLIIHPAAYTAVDQAESEPALAHTINAVAPRLIAEAAARIGAGLIHFSTDYVYDGQKARPYLETDATHPLSVYGRSKLAGEHAIQAVGLPHLILRTSWVFGAEGKNFLNTMLRLFSQREDLSVVDDQFGAPTSARSIAQATALLVERWAPLDTPATGIYHMVNHGETTWYGFAQEIYAQYLSLQTTRGWPALSLKQLLPINTADYPTPAVRPKNSRLSTLKLETQFGIQLSPWQLALAQALNSRG